MGMLSRMSTIVRGKMNRLMDKAENPAESLDVAYDKQMEMLRNVKRGVVEMVTAKRRLELQAESELVTARLRSTISSVVARSLASQSSPIAFSTSR